MGPIETVHGQGGGEDGLRLYLDHIRISDVDLPYDRVAEVAVAEWEPGSSADLSRLTIRLGDGEEFVVALPADQAEWARRVIQAPNGRREGLLEDGPPSSTPSADPVGGGDSDDFLALSVWEEEVPPADAARRRRLLPAWTQGVRDWAFA